MIYVVDDAADYRFLVQQVFKRFLPQYSLRFFADGLDLIQSIKRPVNSVQDQLARPGLILLDVDMPKLNGFQTLEQLKRDPLWQPIPVVMISSRLEANFSEAALQGGAVSYILKPMGLPELQTVMTQLCRQWLEA